MNENIDIFSRTFNRKAGAGRVVEYGLSVPLGSSLADLLSLAKAAGIPLGGRGRNYGGIFEIQTQAGIWSTVDEGKLDLAHGIFKSWEELEKEEIAGSILSPGLV